MRLYAIVKWRPQAPGTTYGEGKLEFVGRNWRIGVRGIRSIFVIAIGWYLLASNDDPIRSYLLELITISSMNKESNRLVISILSRNRNG